jgi:hypothetical protein
MEIQKYYQYRNEKRRILRELKEIKYKQKKLEDARKRMKL